MLYSLGHHRSHGFALLVGILAFPAFAQWSPNDTYRLDQIYLQLGGDYNSSHSIHSDLTEILSFQRRAYNLSTNTYRLLDTFLADFRSVLNPDLQGRYSSVRVDLVLDGYTPYVHRELPYDPRTSAELLVTNRSLSLVQNTLEYIATNIYNSFEVPFDPNIYFLGYNNSQYPPENQLNSFYATLSNYYNAQHKRDFSTATSLYKDLLRKFGSWKWQAMQTYYLLNPSYLIGSRFATNGFARTVSSMMDINNTSDGTLARVYRDSYYDQYSTRALRDHLMTYFNNTGLSQDFVPTNFFTADGTIQDTDYTFTNSSSVFNKFATSFLPSGLFDPEEVDTNLFEYVDADISPNPTFNPRPLQGGTRSRSSASFDYDFDDSDDYSYNLVNPLKTATDVVQDDTDIDNKFQSLADLVNQRISSIFDSPLNSISQEPSRWSVKFRDKDGNSLEEYVSSQQSETSDGITFVCWVIESTMFAGFFFTCVRRSLRIGFAGDPPT